MTNLTAGFLLTELKKCAKPDKAAFLPSFFQCLPGGYGEGDQFLGVIVPDQRQIAKPFRTMPLTAGGRGTTCPFFGTVRQENAPHYVAPRD